MLKKRVMTSLRIVMLLVALVICYLLFAQSQTPHRTAGDGRPVVPVSSEYKQAMDKAHAAARQMQEERREADASGTP